MFLCQILQQHNNKTKINLEEENYVFHHRPHFSFFPVILSSDVNDNVPFFLSSTYEATVPEGAEIGTSVAQVSATDLDSGLHGMVRRNSCTSC